jgi:hypothetical protein
MPVTVTKLCASDMSARFAKFVELICAFGVPVSPSLSVWQFAQVMVLVLSITLMDEL